MEYCDECDSILPDHESEAEELVTKYKRDIERFLETAKRAKPVLPTSPVRELLIYEDELEEIENFLTAILKAVYP
jgi:hypothetical protein